MSARSLEFRGYDAGARPNNRERRARLRELAQQFPEGTRIVHACGREGTVVADQPVHVPGAFYVSTAVCLAGRWHDEPMVFAQWENEYDFTWRVWVPISKVRTSKTPARNRPSNRALTGGRR